MATYLLTYNVPNSNRDETIKRFAKGDGMNAPDGAELIGRWHAAGGGTGWAIIETNDPAILSAWMLQWNDIMDVTFVPVLTDDELGAAFVKNGLM